LRFKAASVQFRSISVGLIEDDAIFEM